MAGESTVVAAACLIKNDGLIAVDQDAAFQVSAHGLGKDHPLQVAPFADEVLH
jgi:hypothetical protein